MMVVFWSKRTTPSPTTIRGQDVELVDTYRHHRVHLINKLDWKVICEQERNGQTQLSDESQVF